MSNGIYMENTKTRSATSQNDLRGLEILHVLLSKPD